MNIHAIIPARAGSKGIPNKNIKLYNGIPLLTHSINYALNNKYISDTVVSTNSPEIAKIAIENGASCPFLRPNEISGDLSRDYDFLKHYVDWLKNNGKKIPDILVQLRPTYPMRPIKLLDNCLDIFMDKGVYDRYDSLRTVVRMDKSPYKTYNIHENTLVPLFENLNKIEEPYNAPRQILPTCYIHDGCIDLIKCDTIISKKSSCGNMIYPYVRNINQDGILDIDTMKDWNKLEEWRRKK